MKIAIHNRKGSFSEEWITYCKRKDIPFKIVDCYQSDIVEQIEGCNALLWHFHHADFKDFLVAKRVLFALEHSGIVVYPNFKTVWHFDDKVGQKYLLENLKAPLVPSYVFYDKHDAIEWAKQSKYPIVFKLRGGAGAKNVMLVRSFGECKRLIDKSFGSGFSQYTIKNAVKDDLLRYRKTGKPVDLLKAVARPFFKPDYAKLQSKEKGYIYFQEFVPENKFDIRVVIVGDKAVAEKRFIRKNDFRASGSGEYSYEGIDKIVIETAFSVAKELGMQSVAFDFVFDKQMKPLIVEISYGFGTKGIANAPGYWDSNLNWYPKKVTLQEWIIEDIIRSVDTRTD